MTPDLAFALIRFAVASSITPGPNNIMLMASGTNFGLRRTLPHMLGVSLGHAFLVLIVGLGLGQVFQAYPMIQTGLVVVCSLYLVYLAYRIATAAPPKDGEDKGRPMTFLEAAAFQWVNPKAVYMAVWAQSFYNVEGTVSAAFAVAGIFCACNLPSVAIWAVMGVQLRNFLSVGNRLRVFNATMAVLLLSTLWPIWRML